MAQVIVIKLRSAGPRLGPFKIEDNFGNVIAESVSREDLKIGVSYAVGDNVTVIIITSLGPVKTSKNFAISEFTPYEYFSINFNDQGLSCAWKHLQNPLIYNTYYGQIEPYIIEYPYAYAYKDQILHSVKDYTKVYKYLDTGDNVLADYAKYELNDTWFNKAVLYNGQQSSGILNLIPKPQNNLQAIGSYPRFNLDSKDILVTKSDNFYQYNTFWSVTKDTTRAQWVKSCESLSIDKLVNQDNMDYSLRSYKKGTLRAKELKVRHILDNRGDVNLVSQFNITPAQISEK